MLVDDLHLRFVCDDARQLEILDKAGRQPESGCPLDNMSLSLPNLRTDLVLGRLNRVNQFCVELIKLFLHVCLQLSICLLDLGLDFLDDMRVDRRLDTPV